jgi:hypothetical protein
MGLTTWRSKVQVRDEDGPKTLTFFFFIIGRWWRVISAEGV